MTYQNFKFARKRNDEMIPSSRRNMNERVEDHQHEARLSTSTDPVSWFSPKFSVLEQAKAQGKRSFLSAKLSSLQNLSSLVLFPNLEKYLIRW